MIKDDNTPFIFISYAHKDSAGVLAIVKRMEESGLQIWYDDRIEPGSAWDENIAAHIEKCACFACFMSNNYLESDNCKDELNYARDLSKKQLMVYLEEVSLPGGMAMRMNRLQAVCLYQYGINDDRGLNKIIEACRSEKITEDAASGKIKDKAVNTRKKFIWPVMALIIAAGCILAAVITVSRHITSKTAKSSIENNTNNDTELNDEELWKIINDYTEENDDWSEMVPYLEKMAENGDEEACAYLGAYYAEHGGNDMGSAIAWCGKGIDKYSSGYCAYLLAYFYFYGKGSFEKPDYVSCLCYVDMAVRLGYHDAAFYGAEIYYKGYLGETDTYKAEQYANIGIDSADEDLAEKCREILKEIE